MFATFALLSIIVTVIFLIWVGNILKTWRIKARDAGYASLGDYLRATPRSDRERQDAVDMALKGLALCLVGLVLPPLMIIGIFPLFFGSRKLAYWRTGLGLFDDADETAD